MPFSSRRLQADLAQSRLFLPPWPLLHSPLSLHAPARSQLALFLGPLCPSTQASSPHQLVSAEGSHPELRPSVLIPGRTATAMEHREARGDSPVPHPSSECDRRAGRAPRGRAASAQLGWGRGPQPALPHQVLSSLQPSRWWGQPGELGHNLHRDRPLVSAQRERPEGWPRAQCVSSLNSTPSHPQHLSLPLPPSYPTLPSFPEL